MGKVLVEVELDDSALQVPKLRSEQDLVLDKSLAENDIPTLLRKHPLVMLAHPAVQVFFEENDPNRNPVELCSYLLVRFYDGNFSTYFLTTKPPRLMDLLVMEKLEGYISKNPSLTPPDEREILDETYQQLQKSMATIMSYYLTKIWERLQTKSKPDENLLDEIRKSQLTENGVWACLAVGVTANPVYPLPTQLSQPYFPTPAYWGGPADISLADSLEVLFYAHEKPSGLPLPQNVFRKPDTCH